MLIEHVFNRNVPTARSDNEVLSVARRLVECWMTGRHYRFSPRGWLMVGLLALAVPVRTWGADCGLELGAWGGTVIHVCHCGDTVRWNYTLSGTLTNWDGTAPCSSSVGLKVASGVILTGDGTAVIRGQSTPGSVGIQFDASIGARVTSMTGYLKVTAFAVGVQLVNNAQNNTVERVESYDNTNGAANGAYGIDLRGPSPNTNTANNTIQNAFVHDNGDEGIHMGGGSRNNTVQTSAFQSNAHQEIYLTNTNSNQILNNTASANTSTGLASLAVKDSDFNTFTGNMLSNRVVTFSDDADHNSFGTAVSGNTISGARLQFTQDADDVQPQLGYRPAHDNTATNVGIDNTTNATHAACVNFKRNSNATGGDTLPYNNSVSLATLTCNSKSLIALSAGSGVPFVVGQNCVGASTCNGHTCTEAGDATDQLGIITVQGQACP